MPRVTVRVGCTVKLGDPLANYGNYFKCDMEIADIDTERDVTEQITGSSSALKTTFKYLMDKMNKELDAQLDAKLE